MSFWRLVGVADGRPLEPIDWPGFRVELARRSPKIRHDLEGLELSGTVHTRHEVDHLVLTKDRDDLPREQHAVRGQVADMRTTGDDWVAIESAFIAFLEFGNVRDQRSRTQHEWPSETTRKSHRAAVIDMLGDGLQ